MSKRDNSRRILLKYSALSVQHNESLDFILLLLLLTDSWCRFGNFSVSVSFPFISGPFRRKPISNSMKARPTFKVEHWLNLSTVRF